MFGEMAMDTTFPSTGVPYLRVVCLGKEISLSDCSGAVVQDPGHSLCRHGDLHVCLIYSFLPGCFEVKTFNFCPTRYNHNNQHINPANRRAREIVNQYKCKVRKLDIMFAAAVVGDGNNNVIGPFKNALSQFHGKTVIPQCFSAFGEVNEDLETKSSNV
jgi:hypothetical protein